MTRILVRSLLLLVILSTAHGAGPAPFDFPLTLTSAQKRTNAYPWHDHITTTVFWIDGNATQTAWGLNWNPGVQDQRATDVHRLNPYYFALPFNDLKHPDLADHWLPAGWVRTDKPSNGPATIHTQNGTLLTANWQPRSSCLGRWIEIKNANGQICYARWADFGPRRDDDAPYVFGAHRPVDSHAGLDVSPAVAKQLGIDGSAILSWRFVNDEDVQRGPWLDRDGGQTLIASPGI